MASEAIDAGAGDGARAEAPSPPSWTTLSLSMVARGGARGSPRVLRLSRLLPKVRLAELRLQPARQRRRLVDRLVVAQHLAW